MATSWVETTSVGTLKSEDLAKADLVFRYNRYVYRTSGTHLSNGGMGTVYELDRRDDETGAEERVVGKVFHSSYLYQLRTDEVTRRDHHNNLAAMARIAAIEHPNILPTYVSAPIADNYLFVTPRMGTTLLEAITKHNLTPRASCTATSRCATSSSTTARTSPTCSTSISRCPSTTSGRRRIATTTRAASSARRVGPWRRRRSIKR